MKVITPIKTVDSGSFTRQGFATYYDQNGVMRTAYDDRPRYSYDPENLSVGPKLLVEKAATNFIAESEDISPNAVWSVVNIASVVLDSVTPAYTPVAIRLIENFINSVHFIEVGPTGIAAITEQAYTFSVFVKADGRTNVQLSLGGNAQTRQNIVNVNLATKAFTFTGINAKVQTLPGGWLRLSIAGYSENTTLKPTISLQDSAGNNTYAGDGISGMFVWGAQLEAGTVATSYIQTSTVVVTRYADVNATTLLSSAIEVTLALYNAGTMYAYGEQVSVVGALGLVTNYSSIMDSNLGNTPATTPLSWTNIGTTYESYSAAVTYAAAHRVISPSTHLVYESIAAGNIGQALTNTAKWLLIGPTNRTMMLDLLRNTPTTVPGWLSFTFKQNTRADSIALIGLQANKVSVSIFDSNGNEIYTYFENLDVRKVSTWSQFFYTPFVTKKAVTLFDLPQVYNATISVTLVASSGNVSIGAAIIGKATDIGRVQYSAQNDVLNFSTVTRDFAGNTNVMVQRKNVPKTISNLFIDRSKVDTIRALRDSLGATPAVWAGLESNSDEYFEALLILGFYKKFSINLAYPQQAVISLELEEI